MAAPGRESCAASHCGDSSASTWTTSGVPSGQVLSASTRSMRHVRVSTAVGCGLARSAGSVVVTTRCPTRIDSIGVKCKEAAGFAGLECTASLGVDNKRAPNTAATSKHAAIHARPKAVLRLGCDARGASRWTRVEADGLGAAIARHGALSRLKARPPFAKALQCIATSRFFSASGSASPSGGSSSPSYWPSPAEIASIGSPGFLRRSRSIA